MTKKTTGILSGAIFILFVLGLSAFSKGKPFSGPLTPLNFLSHPQDSTDKKNDKLPYPIKDRDGDFVTDQNDNPFLLDDPSAVKKEVVYDPETNLYLITETIDGRNVKAPTYMTFEEYRAYERKQSQKEYWDERSQAITLVERRGIIPKLYVGKNIFDRLFGGTTVDIRPSGNIDLTFGGNVQKIDNPGIPESARKQGGFDFDMNINMNVVGKIGEKVKVNLSYNTEATFDFENQIKLNYEGEEDDIIKKIEGGNVSFALPTSLINGSQSLFGLYTKLQFGRLTLTNVYSQQKSKAETLTIADGAQTQTFKIFADQYDENRHYFLSQYFRDNFNAALFNLPNINSQVQITNVEVWVTNEERVTENTRYIVALMDLGEFDSIYRKDIIRPLPGGNLPANSSNDLYNRLIADEANTKSIDKAISTLEGSFNLRQVQDFEKTYARQLSPSEFSFHDKLGYISLNQRLDPDEILAVAYEYNVNGVTYKVGEFARNGTPGLDVDTNTTQIDTTQRVDKILFLKMLKSTAVRTSLPIWKLMMKNIYPLGAFQVNAEDFKLNVVYQDPGGGSKRYMPEGSLVGTPIIRVLSLDNLNNQGDPQPDGIFDFLPGITINPSNGRIIFPVLEPFGDDLRSKFAPGEDLLVSKYVYDQLYDSTKTVAQQFPQYNRFALEGSYKSSVTNEISLGAFNVPQGSVTVTAGGQKLVEGRDFQINYSLGRVTILNEGILKSGIPINVSYENNALFGFQTKTLFGARADYWINDNFTLGATFMHLKERPFTEKVNVGDDPISNSIIGFDFNYNTKSNFLTWMVDKLPFYETKSPSSFTLTGEMARLKPGHQKAIGKDGTVYIDDFEGTRSSYSLKFPSTSWYLASTPQGSRDRTGAVLFPEAELRDSLPYGYNRAKLAWYLIDQFLQGDRAPNYIKGSGQQQNHYMRLVDQQEVFPNKSLPVGYTNLTTFDLAYYPEERGLYNFDHTSASGQFPYGVNPDGTLSNPKKRWGGIMRSIDNNDFEASNIEFIEFWLLDPFIDNPNSEGGEFYINIGNVSEDINKDGRRFYENGIPRPGSTVRVDSTSWGLMPTTQPITNSFDNDQSLRELQDVGLDGLNSANERTFFSDAVNSLGGFLSATPLREFTDDPASDDFRYYLDGRYDPPVSATILERYKRYNGMEGNSPSSGTQGSTNIPDSEDLNRDNTMNESEQYFQYRIELKPNMQVGENFVTDKLVTPVPGTTEATWYQFKVPIDKYESKVNDISDFKSIRFMRMFLTDFEEPVVLRFAEFDLVRNQWRRYLFSLAQARENIPNDDFGRTFFNVSAVNVEENSEKSPFPYALPPDIAREQSISSNNTTTYQNEQSLSVQVCGLEDGDARAVYKTINLDLRTYARLKMFIHGESLDPANPLDPDKPGEVQVFIRLGSDFTDNYYEYAFPLTVTRPGTYFPESEASRQAIWPAANYIDLVLDSFIVLKQLRNNDPTASPSSAYFIPHANGTFSIKGNPDLGLAKTAMLGIRNPRSLNKPGEPSTDDRQPKCAEVWFNELRLSGLDEGGGWAALARMETQLADLGSVVFSTNMHTAGYGQLEQKVDQRFKDNFVQYDGALSLDVGKFFPKKVGFKLPMYASLAQSFSTPQYDPYELDVPLKDKLAFKPESEKKDYKRQAQNLETIKSINFTNVRFAPEKKGKPRLWDVANLNFTFAYTNTKKSDPFVESDVIKKYKASMGYNYSPQAKYWYPFKKAIKAKTKYLDIIRDINFNIIPSNLSFSTDMNRQFGETVLRILGEDAFAPDSILKILKRYGTTYNKYFTWDRFYGLKYNPTQSITFDFTAVNNARIDEPEGRLDTKAKKDSLWSSIGNFGRTTNYSHSVNANYNVPLNKFPILDWISVRGGYNSTYNWTSGGFTSKVKIDTIVTPGTSDTIFRKSRSNELEKNPFGNTISNSQGLRLNGELNFKKLYDNFKGLKPYNSSSARPKQTSEELKKKIKENEKRKEKIENDIEKLKNDIVKIKTDIKEVKKDEKVDNKKEEVKKLKLQIKAKKEGIKKLKNDKARITPPERPVASPFVRPWISIKRISANYSETRSTYLPGYVPETRFLGQDRGFETPGLRFIFGYQPNKKWLDDAAAKGWITADTSQNLLYMQSVSKNLDIKATIEPFRDFRVDLTLTRTQSENRSELFRRQLIEGNYYFEHLSPLTTGSYTISFISVKTLFQKTDDQGLTAAYNQFLTNRSIISKRLQQENPNSSGFFQSREGRVDTNYAQGYGPFSQDVLMPAFLAAYTGKSAKDIKNLNPFKTLPLPNWRITYNGLSKLWGLSKFLQSVNITHAYNSSMSINGYRSESQYRGSYTGMGTHNDSLFDNNYFHPSVVDTLNMNFFPRQSVPQIVVSERFSPLIGVDITWAKNVTTKFDYNKTRNLSMSFVDYQLSESKSDEFTFGMGYRLKGLTIPIKIRGKKRRLENDINFRFEFSYRNNVTTNLRLDEDVAEPTRGMKTYTISPSIDYVINSRLNVKIFFDRNKSIPATSASYPITNTKAGITLRFSLTQ